MDEVTLNAINRASFFIGILNAAIVYQWAFLMSYMDAEKPTLVAIAASFVARQMSKTLLAPINAAISTIYVGFVENPEALQRTHPALFEPMAQAWRAIGYDFLTSVPHLEEGNTPAKTATETGKSGKTLV